MQDPSFGVPQQLLNHVHLVSGHKFPYMPRMGLDVAFQYLSQAPQIVKQMAPMSWQYLNAPSDGTLFLTWAGPRTGNVCPTDGYVWAGQEEHVVQDFGGFTLEIAMHSNGFRPGVDQLACHSRKRYRLVAKNPHTVSPPPDTNLWLIHYQQSDPTRMMQAADVQVTPMTQHFLQERKFIEAQGRLERQDFMLHDREKWPQLKMPSRGAPGGQMYAQQNYHGQNPMAHVANQRFGGQYYQGQQPAMAGPSPAKRQRQHPPQSMPGAPSAMAIQDTTIEDEEDVSLDIRDHLTQRDISMTRYMRHHEWMEEVFSSPYATSQIVPVDLGFGLIGELSGLTEGIFETISAEKDKAQANGKDTTSYKKVEPDQLREFEKRVNEHLEKGQAELQRMRDEHAKRMEGMRRTKTLARAERKLRMATWDHDDSEALHEMNGNAHGVKGVVKEVEQLLGVTIKPQKEAELVEKGGLREKIRPPPVPEPAPTNENMDGVQSNGVELPPPGFSQNQAQQDTLTSAQISREVSATPHAMPAQPIQSQQTPMTNQLPEQHAPVQQQQLQQPQMSGTDATMDTMDTMDNIDTLGDDMLMDDMDLDDGDASLNFDHSENNTMGAEDQSHSMAQAMQQANPTSTTTGPTTNTLTTAANIGEDRDAIASAQDGSNQGAGQGELFNGTTDNTFDDFAGDGLIDFEGGGGGGGDIGLSLGMDNSAFGDAFDATEPRNEVSGE